MKTNLGQNKNQEQNLIQQFVCFKLADEEYAIDIHCVQEAIRPSQITHIPQMPDFCLGVLNIRGLISSVFDLRKLFHLPEKPFDPETRVLVISIDNITISFIVDMILENIKLETSSIDPAPSVKMNIDKECICGLGALEGRMIVIIDASKIQENIFQKVKKNSKKRKNAKE